MGMSDEVLLSVLNDQPELRSRIELLLLAIEDESGNLRTADAAEMYVIEQMKKIGHESLQAWASRQSNRVSESVKRDGKAWRAGKKNSSGTPPMVK